jgi:hypothetical protein
MTPLLGFNDGGSFSWHAQNYLVIEMVRNGGCLIICSIKNDGTVNIFFISELYNRGLAHGSVKLGPWIKKIKDRNISTT